MGSMTLGVTASPHNRVMVSIHSNRLKKMIHGEIERRFLRKSSQKADKLTLDQIYFLPMEDNLGNSRETMPENLSKSPERTKPETKKNSPEKSSETTKNSQEKTNSSKNSPENSSINSTQNTSRNSPENIPETASKNFQQNVSETIQKSHPDEDVDPFKLFNIPKHNVYVLPEIVPPAAEATQSPRFGGKGKIGRKSPGNKRPVFAISVSSSSASSSSSSESEDEIETTTPETTIQVSSSTSEEELVNSMKEIKIKSKEQLYKEQQEKRMAKMEATMQLILEKLDKKERKGIYEENKELVEETRAKKEIVQQVKEGGDQEKLEETIPKSEERKIIEELPESQATKILQLLSQIIYLRRLEINLEGIENTKKVQKTYPNSHVDEMKTFRSFYEEQVKRVEEKMNDFQVHWRPQIES